MKYCSHCGAALDEEDRFCFRCGRITDSAVHMHADVRHAAVYSAHTSRHAAGREESREPLEKLACELAYSGFLFWLPLLLCPSERNTRFCANQGLWALITATAACLAVQLVGAVNTALSGTIPGVIFEAVYAMIFAVFLLFLLFLLCSCVKNALAVHNGKKPASILFFDERRIIREA